MIILETDRLRLEESTLADGSFCYELMNSPNWIRFIGDRGIKTVSDAEKYIQNSHINSYKEHGFGLWKMVLKSENQSIGFCGLLKRPHLEYSDIGFAIFPRYEGQGLVSEAAHATMKYAKSKLGLTTILGVTDTENIGSQKILQKIGLEFVENIKWNGTDEEVMLFSN